MARGKYAVRSENRNWDGLRNRVETLETELERKKKALHDLQKDWLRLKNIEKLFDDKKDVLKEMHELRAELDDAQGRLLVHVERERRWAEMMMAPENEDFVRINPAMTADLVQLGYWPERLVQTRRQRRNTRSGKAVRQALSANGYQ